MKQRNDDLIVVVDIGSSKVSTIISEMNDAGNISVLGIGESEISEGVRHGVVVNINSVVEAISSSINEAEMQAGREVNGVYVGISGSNIESINSKGVVAIAGADKEIRNSDIDRVIEAAKAVAIPMDREILHIIPQGFAVDGQENIKLPIGMVGTRLEAQIHILTTAISSIQNVVRCFERLDVEIYDIVLQNIASSSAVLTTDEKELGALVLDIGSSTTKVSIHAKQAPYFNSIYKLGGFLITNDLSAGLKISLNKAEAIKLHSGLADTRYADKTETVLIPSLGGGDPKTIARANLVHIIKPRIEEIFQIIKQDLNTKGALNQIKSNIVLTGGTAELPGIAEVCEEVFGIPARIGYPPKFAGFGDKLFSPKYSVINGLLIWAYDKIYNDDNRNTSVSKGGSKKPLFSKLRDFFEDFF